MPFVTNIIENGQLRVCFFGTYRANYVRNQVMINGLRSQGVEVYECHATLWHSVADRVEQAGGGWKNPRFLGRVLKAYLSLCAKHARVPEYDVMLIGYPGQFDAYLARLLSWWRRKPMALDILMSLHLIAEERGLTQRSPVTGKLIFYLEKIGLKLPNLLIADTLEYEAYYRGKYRLASDRFTLVPLGIDDRIFRPLPNIEPPKNRFRVIYYGTFIPLHGIETILYAAAELAVDLDVQFDFYGEGQEKPRAETLAKQLKLENVQFHGWIDEARLPEKIAQSHVSLGVFGTTKQSRITIQNKIWESMAMARPVITGDAPTIRRELVDMEEIYLVAREDPSALAQGIRHLKADPTLRERIAIGGYRRSQANTISATGSLAKNALKTLRSS